MELVTVSSRLSLLVAAVLAAAVVPTRATSQEKAEPALYAQARSQLASADTAAALGSLRQLTKEEPDFAPGWGLLGRVLTAKASGVATDFGERREAEAALRRALALDQENPGYLVALAELERKQQIYLDARRVLDRALGMMEREPERAGAAERAELWYQRGLFYEDVYLDSRHQVFASDLQVSALCVNAPTFCMNFTRPREFNERLKHAKDLSQFGEDDYRRMGEAFRKALAADRTHSGAFRRLAIHLIDLDDLEGALELAERYRGAAPDDPWAYITLGLVYHRMGQDSLAEIAFERGLERAPREVAAHYRDVAPILREGQAKKYRSANDLVRRWIEEVLWRKSDPLYLTGENEVRVAHLARVAFADLMYEDPSEGVWGSDTEQGVIYVRYGPPLRIWQVRRDATRELTALDIAELEGFVPPRRTSRHGGGRWIFWNYGYDLPNFIFQKPLRYRHASHQFDSFSKDWEQEARRIKPAHYRTSFEIVDYPLQFARFKGATEGVVELDVYSEVPSRELLASASADSLEAGVFVFAGSEYAPVYERKLHIPVPPQYDALTYTLRLPPGRFDLSVEARTLAPRSEAPADRRDFAIAVNRRLEFAVYDPFAIYWEVCGLRRDADGLAHYRVSVALSKAEGGGVVARIVGALGELLGLAGNDSPQLSFERVVAFNGERVPEYLSLQPGTDEPGSYRVSVQITDELSGASVSRERLFRVNPD